MGELVSRALHAAAHLACAQISLARGWKVWQEGFSAEVGSCTTSHFSHLLLQVCRPCLV